MAVSRVLPLGSSVLMPQSRLGMAQALAGFALLSLGDAVVKTMTDEWPSTGIAALRYALGAAGLAALLLAREGPDRLLPAEPRLHLLRGFAVALATSGFFAALMFMPLAEATAITFTSPMLTALLAGPLLGEKVRARTVLATLVAFAGVLIVLRPGLLTLGWPALLPLLSALGMSLLMIGNRKAAGRASPLAMQAWVALFAAPLLIGIAIAGHLAAGEGLRLGWPDWTVIARCAVVAASASTAHWLIFLGTTRVGAARIAPMTYVQLLVATAVGWLGFGHLPDLATIGGAGIIVGAGIALWQAERRESAR